MPSLYEGLGTEELLDTVDMTLRNKLNDAIAYQQEIGNTRDVQRALELAALGVEVVDATIDLEEVPQSNFHVGSVPSFVQTYEDRVENYPLVAVTPGRTAPDAEDPRADQISIFQNAVSIHTFARAQPREGENHAEIAWRRAARMSEAMHQVVSTDRLLSSVVAGLSGPMLVDRSEPWYYPAEDGAGEDWCWIWIMSLYQVKNYSKKPQEV